VVDGVPIPMLSPVAGEVVEVNPEVLRSPEILREDPYGKGWLLKVKSTRIASNTRNLLSGKLAKAWMESALDKLHPLHGESLGRSCRTAVSWSTGSPGSWAATSGSGWRRPI